MPELQFAEGVLARLHAQGESRFDERAYLFVLSGIEFLQSRLDKRRHVTGQELAWACRDHALERFGLLSRTVLEHWGVRETADFGRIVFALVGIGLLSTQPGDRLEDFEGVYEFERAFEAHYTIAWRQDG
ncbi:MAG: Minf_1886 family protein [Gemmatimonadota bacterium]